MKTVRELCKEIKGSYNIEGNASSEICGISADSRKIEKEYLFVCIAGFHVDGASFAGQAVEKGAVAVLTTKHLDLPQQITQITVADIHAALEDMVPFFYGYPGKAMRMIGVTGTNGKTRRLILSPTSFALQVITSVSSVRYTPLLMMKNWKFIIRRRTSWNCRNYWPLCRKRGWITSSWKYPAMPWP